jgi:hypothetical protein
MENEIFRRMGFEIISVHKKSHCGNWRKYILEYALSGILVVYRTLGADTIAGINLMA